MLKIRVIPCLQLIDESLVKTVKFDQYSYIGDPINTVRIFNELEVDELAFLDIRATVKKQDPNLKILSEIANECFMPLSYGGGIKDFDTAKRILKIGFEKIIINSYAIESPEFITELADYFGSQSVVGSIDAKKNIWGQYQVYSHDGTKKHKLHPQKWACELEQRGCGELLVTSMERDGTWSGYDSSLIKNITDVVSIPVIANGGAGTVDHLGKAVDVGGASAVCFGSMVVYQAKEMGILVNFPDKSELNKVLG